MYYNELYHYGIKGQRWGVKNGPPYPLSAATSAKVRMNVKHDEYKLSLDDKYSTSVMKKFNDTHPIETLSSLKKRSRKADIKQIRYDINHTDDDDLEYGRSYNCPNCAAAFDMVERGYDVCARPKHDGSNVENIESFYKGGHLESVNNSNVLTEHMPAIKEALNNYSTIDKEVKKLGEDFDKWAKSVNDSYGVRKLTRSEKNKFLKDAYKRLDAIKDVEHKRNDEMRKVINEVEKAREKAEKLLNDKLAHQEDGSRGIIVVGWQDNYDFANRTKEYHAFNYKIENGKPKFYDVQSGREAKYNGFDSFSTYRSEIDPREIYVMRTDNLEPSEIITTAVYSNKLKRR